MSLYNKINYNKDQIITFLLCMNHNENLNKLPPEIILYIISFLDSCMDLTNLTKSIERLGLEDNLTTKTINLNLWTDINKLRFDMHRDLSLENWKYKSEFISAENNNTSEDHKTFKKLNWQESFTLEIFYSIYH